MNPTAFPRRHRILTALASGEALTIAELARRTGIGDSNVRHVVGDIVVHGQVERIGERPMSRRNDFRPVRITAAGLERLARMAAAPPVAAKAPRRLPVATGGHLEPGHGPRHDCARYDACLRAYTAGGEAHCATGCPCTVGRPGRRPLPGCDACHGTGCRWHVPAAPASATAYTSSSRTNFDAAPGWA